MPFQHRAGETSYEELLRVVRYARNRWRLKVALRGALMVFGVGFLAFAASVWGMDYFLYSDTSVVWFRVLTYVAIAALVVRFLIVPLSKRVSDERVALYIEEHEPSLQESLISAVELGKQEAIEPGDERSRGRSLALEQHLLASAIDRCQEIDYGQEIEQSPLKRFSAGLAGLATAGMVAILLSPAFLQHGAMMLFLPWRGDVESPYQVAVEPGSLSLPRGSDQQVHAQLLGFDSDSVELAVKQGEEGSWQRYGMTRLQELDAAEVTMLPGAEATFEHMLLNLQDNIEYFVVADTVRSPIFRIEVTDLPYVERIDLELEFPAYTGLSPQLIEDGGDIAALKGTTAHFRVLPTIPVTAGRILVDEETALPLSVAEDGVLVADLEVSEPGYYRVELASRDGTLHRSSPEYVIDVLEDQPPILRFRRPGRDIKATKIEEIFTEVEAEDDYGLQRIELVFSVNGGDEQVVSLYGSGRGSGRKEVTAGHTFFLEEWDLQDGDFIAYYARARDRQSSQHQTASDIYFVEVRPFGQNYRRQEGGGGGGGGGGGLDNSLSQTQRQIIAATFRLIRDKATYSSKEWSENLATVSLMQGRLREQVETLVVRMQNRASMMGGGEFETILAALGQASEAMKPAAELLRAEKPQEAMPPEQKALQALQRAEASFRDVRVSFDPSGGGGGGGSHQLAEDLADLFELELDKLRNQYETVQRGEQQQLDNEIDEALQKLKELARRQQQENERQNRRALSQPGGNGSSRNQQDLIEQAEELARQLERLSREHGRPELQESARRLRDAAESMRRSGTTRNDEAIADRVSALDGLREARRLLDQNRGAQLERDLEEARQRAERIAEQQQRIDSQVGALGSSDQASRRGDGAREYQDRLQRIVERKEQLEQEVAGLEEQLDRLAQQARADEGEAARHLSSAANSIRNNQLKEKIRYSKGVVRGRESSYAQLFEQEISKDISEMLEGVTAAEEALGGSQQGQESAALERARELVQNLESLEARLRDQGEAGSRQDDAQGQQGESGSESGEETARQGQQPGEQGQQGSEQGQQTGQQGQRLAENRGSQSQGSESQGSESQGSERGQGQQGQPGQEADPSQQAQSSQSGDASGRGAAVSGATRIGTGPTGWFQPGLYGTEDLRQAQRELSERLREGRELRDQIAELGLETADLDDILNAMSRFRMRRLNNDPLALDELRAAVVDGLRQFEFRLWRELEGGEEQQLRLSNSDEVPSGYRQLVEDYYRALAAVEE